jgi:asparagine synthase (glutamine-hydrolysing)
MSVQFGRWNFDTKEPDPDYFASVRASLASYGPDGHREYAGPGIRILYLPFRTTKESRGETQPWVSASGRVFTWDGRLDNREQLVRELQPVVSADHSDVSIVSAAYDRWGVGSLARLLGDWALSVWEHSAQTLLLAKDFLGSRCLYYSLEDGCVTWSTILDPLATFAGHHPRLQEEYIAGWLSFFPAAHLTPYAEIYSVPPSECVLIRNKQASIQRYWDFDFHKRILYTADAEYEEHFRSLFTQSVSRRLRADAPVLAELSGGMDSSAIVCVADRVIAEGRSEVPRLDTVSYYNDSEPNWDEKPYFGKVEELRGRMGCHIDVSSPASFQFDCDGQGLPAMPGSKRRRVAASKFAECLDSQGNRVVLCGIGGDEVTGGVPTPLPELRDLLAGAHFIGLVRQLKAWALHKRRPWFQLFFDAARGFFPGEAQNQTQAPWVDPHFLTRFRMAFAGYETRLSLSGPPPSFQEHLSTLNCLRRQLACTAPSSKPLYERRYPYLDRDLLEFLYAIPQEQLVRPGQRRSLMRRALAGIVPAEILDRKRKAFVTRAPLAALSTGGAYLAALTNHMVSGSLGFVNPQLFFDALEKARLGQDANFVAIDRTLVMEAWLRCLTDRNAICISMPQNPERRALHDRAASTRPAEANL